MLKTLLFVVFGFAVAWIAPKTGGALGYKFDKDHIKSWAEEGKKAGAYAMEAFSKAETAVKDMLLAIADAVAGTPSAEDFLTGYASSWSNDQTAKSRKTDARAVFEAYSIKNEKGDESLLVERQIAWAKNADGTDKLDERKLRIPVMDTKSVQDWLLDYDGDFAGFLKLARELRNHGTGRQSQGTVINRKTRVTDNQFANIMQQIPVMGAQQAHTTIVEGLKQVAKVPNFEVALVNQMELSCNILKTSKNPLCQEAASEIIDVLNGLREKLAHAEKLAAEAKANTQGKTEAVSGTVNKAAVDFQVPTPAEQPKTGTQG